MKTQLVDITQSSTIDVAEDTKYVLRPLDYSADKHYDLEFVFEQPGVSAELIMLYSLPKDGFLNVTTIANHKTTNTSCLTKVKGVLNDGAVSNYIGKIIINKAAQQTSSFLEDHVLVLGKGTKNNSQPILQIEADDVHASHGATTGRIDEMQVYYLMSRGLSRTEAEKLVVEGFFTELVAQIEDEKVQAAVLKSLEVLK